MLLESEGSAAAVVDVGFIVERKRARSDEPHIGGRFFEIVLENICVVQSGRPIEVCDLSLVSVA